MKPLSNAKKIALAVVLAPTLSAIAWPIIGFTMSAKEKAEQVALYESKGYAYHEMMDCWFDPVKPSARFCKDKSNREASESTKKWAAQQDYFKENPQHFNGTFIGKLAVKYTQKAIVEQAAK